VIAANAVYQSLSLQWARWGIKLNPGVLPNEAIINRN
jgi:hypothetical protein